MIRNDVLAWENAESTVKRAVVYAVLVHLCLFLIVFPRVKEKVPDAIPISDPPILYFVPPPPPQEILEPVRPVNPFPGTISVTPPEMIYRPEPAVEPAESQQVEFSAMNFEPPPPPPPVPETVIRVPGVDAPTALYRPDPTYPATAVRLGRGGIVLAKILIGVDGIVESVEILRTEEGILGKVLAEEVRETLSAWRYEPATVEGWPVKVQMTITTIFTLD